MEKNQIAYLIRGEKWFNIRRVKVVLEKVKDVEWLDSQKSIVDDIKNYTDFMEKMKAEGFTDLGQLDQYELKIAESKKEDTPDVKEKSKSKKEK